MKFRFVSIIAIVFSLSSAYGAPHQFSGSNHAVAALLLSDSDQSVKLAGKSLFSLGSDDHDLVDLFGEVIWTACSGKRQLSVDTLSWLAKAIGKTRQLRYAGLLDYCLSKEGDEKTVSYLKWAKGELTVASASQFQGGHLDLPGIRARVNANRSKVDRKQFEQSLHAGQTLSDVYSTFGYPDQVGMASIPAGEVGFIVHVQTSQPAIELLYKDAGTIQFIYQDGQPDWTLDNAASTTGLFWSRLDGRFVILKNQIAKGDGERLREIGQSLLVGKALEKDVSAAIHARISVTVPDENDFDLVDGLVWTAKAVMEKGSPEDEKSLVMYLLAHGNGRQLQGVAEHLIDKGPVEGDVADAAMARVSSSRATEDKNLADGLAWLCKVMPKSGNAKYKNTLLEISETAGRRSLRKYAKDAADAL